MWRYILHIINLTVHIYVIVEKLRLMPICREVWYKSSMINRGYPLWVNASFSCHWWWWFHNHCSLFCIWTFLCYMILWGLNSTLFFFFFSLFSFITTEHKILRHFRCSSYNIIYRFYIKYTHTINDSSWGEIKPSSIITWLKPKPWACSAYSFLGIRPIRFLGSSQMGHTLFSCGPIIFYQLETMLLS